MTKQGLQLPAVNQEFQTLVEDCEDGPIVSTTSNTCPVTDPDAADVPAAFRPRQAPKTPGQQAVDRPQNSRRMATPSPSKKDRS